METNGNLLCFYVPCVVLLFGLPIRFPVSYPFPLHAQRGKFRPRLVDLAGSNENSFVEKTTSDAFKKLDKDQLKSSIEFLCKLKGIGPATASGMRVISLYMLDI